MSTAIRLIDLVADDRKVMIEAYYMKILSKDINTLHGTTWINDEVVNFYMQMLSGRSRPPATTSPIDTDIITLPIIYTFSTFFYTKLHMKGIDSVRSWTKEDIFINSLIFIPIHHCKPSKHWCLVVINMETQEIMYYDSKGGYNQQCVKDIQMYMREEYLSRKGRPLDLSTWHIRAPIDIPLQDNDHDCGMFMLKYAEYISRRAKITFSQEDIPLFRNRMKYEITHNHLVHP